MPFTFQPKTEQEVIRIFEKGDYRFIVKEAGVKNDKNGNPMMYVKMQVFHHTIPGKTVIVDTWLTHNTNFEFLIRHFSYSIGLGECYETGSIEPRICIGKEGIVRLGIEKSDKYPDKNKAIDFLVVNNMPTANIMGDSNVGKDLNDDVPF